MLSSSDVIWAGMKLDIFIPFGAERSSEKLFCSGEEQSS